MKVSLFLTCLADVVYPASVGKSSVELLERFGCEVDFPKKQTCCGQPAFNSGFHKESREVAKHMIATFEHASYVVSPSGSCTAMLHEYPKLFEDDPDWLYRAEALKNKSYELTQFLVHVLNVEDVGAELPANATYHTSCHMTRLLGEKEAPMKLLKNVKGLTVYELPYKEQCCGFGGTFSVKMMPISEQMVDEKVEHVEETGAEILIGADLGCLMNIGGRIERKGKPVKVMHIADVLNTQAKAEVNT
ncbi:(Fe-S)-binding protein [Salisediminibacterium halotolerans]|uniref:Lactate utilization protein A n=1 Tax=Salisediminibacterium halotolerans TaxID=517425 RepID=A0A1H9VB46_9BACI|nr:MULTISPECIES: (Fe-S)-binding protein [Salisediminibacterium]RLJ78372.1 L-lactate dehydrogenase complex protein LldE [Actinophytocola xinjiangensis]RPE88286.1 L-lactate dehydrogenase complex protein LldE [Salisediminibacterium halotolerans]TWG37348.1 L-lactate dehydrogenase complex protein LldE [Salisediminibacterium halotolerans]SES18809.1 L-lactate dehydrogenase complex protein LldE [Salisediminibacterium haloalkalitolerans]GEL06813.1 lactate utilization protein A [Salisediminibacterium ha